MADPDCYKYYPGWDHITAGIFVNQQKDQCDDDCPRDNRHHIVQIVHRVFNIRVTLFLLF